jgi:hypothetical protein
MTEQAGVAKASVTFSLGPHPPPSVSEAQWLDADCEIAYG